MTKNTTRRRVRGSVIFILPSLWRFAGSNLTLFGWVDDGQPEVVLESNGRLMEKEVEGCWTGRRKAKGWGEKEKRKRSELPYCLSALLCEIVDFQALSSLQTNNLKGKAEPTEPWISNLARIFLNNSLSNPGYSIRNWPKANSTQLPESITVTSTL